VDFQPMTPDDIERTMQFLLRQQAQFAADMDRLSGKTDRIADGLIGLTGIVGRLAEQTRETDERFREADARLTEQIKATDEQIRMTEAHLNILIEMFERHLRESHGGERPS
jgi:predicted  nucleic acid-binding Zn-ribbon protein